MFKNVIVRAPGKSLINGIPADVDLGRPDFNKAVRQHKSYIKALESCGVTVTKLEPLEEFPDSCFIEDAAVLTPKCAIITNPGAASREREPEYVIESIKQFYDADQICHIKSSGTVEGGDVMMVGNHFYIGESGRTNAEGCKQFAAYLEKFGHTSSVVPLEKVLHLKTGMSYLENNCLLLAGEFVDMDIFKTFNKIIVGSDEAYCANCIWVNDKVIVPFGYPKTEAAIVSAGFDVITVDMSEYQKLNGGLSCLSLRF